VGVIVCVGLLACVGVGEGVKDPETVAVGDIVARAVPLLVAEAVGVGDAGGVSVDPGLGRGDLAVPVGTVVLGGEAGRVAVIVAGVPVVSRGGSSIGVWVVCCPPVCRTGLFPWYCLK